jgi:hypothetical protein
MTDHEHELNDDAEQAGVAIPAETVQAKARAALPVRVESGRPVTERAELR